jgi:H+-transporting ATPase
MTPLGWKWAGFVWGYALIWFLINDRIKLLAYRIFDRTKDKSKTGTAVLQKSDDKAGSAPEVKKEMEPGKEEDAIPAGIADSDSGNTPKKTPEGAPVEQKAETANLEDKTTPKTEVKEAPPSQIKAKADPDIGPNAEPKTDMKETLKTEAPAEQKADLGPSAKTEATTTETKADPGTKRASKPEDKTMPEAGVKTPKPETKAEPDPRNKTDLKAESKSDTTETPKTEGKSDLTPGLVQRVHELYEELVSCQVNFVY